MTPERPPVRPARLALLGFAVAFALTLASAGVQRRGPELGAYGNVCGPAGNDPCLRPVLNGGWPLAFVHDAPGVSVEDRLGPEDRVRALPAVADVAFYWSLLALSWGYGRLRRRHTKKTSRSMSGRRGSVRRTGVTRRHDDEVHGDRESQP